MNSNVTETKPTTTKLTKSSGLQILRDNKISYLNLDLGANFDKDTKIIAYVNGEEVSLEKIQDLDPNIIKNVVVSKVNDKGQIRIETRK